MRPVRWCAIAVTLLLRPSCTQPSAVLALNSLAFIHATVVDVTDGTTRTDLTVVIIGNHIAEVGRTGEVQVPAGVRLINATGKFLIPGLWNMHVHLGGDDADRDYHLRAYLINGVTGIRFMDGDSTYHAWRKQAEHGTLLAPRMVIASQTIGSGHLANVTAARAREEVRHARETGADFVKVHDNVSRDAYFAIVEESKAVALPLAGHVPASVTAAEAAGAGQRSIEHFGGLGDAASDASTAGDLIAVLTSNRTWVCPTIVMRRNYASLDDDSFAKDPRLSYVKPSWRRRWLGMTTAAVGSPAQEWDRRREIVEGEMALVGLMQRSGVGILAGTDDANPYVIPGFSLHDELTLLVKAGLTPLEALQAATVNPARFLGKDDALGTIEKGKFADLVLLDANPLDRIENASRVWAIVTDGRYIDNPQRRRILTEIADAFKENQ